MLTRHMITRRANDDGVDAQVVERDYILAHVVAQLHGASQVTDSQLVFKGGTALRFVYFDTYRYSADLDITVIDGSTVDALNAFAPVLEAARKHTGIPHLELTKTDKPGISYIGPLQAENERTIKLDLTTEEYVECVARRTISNVWPDLPVPIAFSCYPIGEIAAEKLRCIIQRLQCRDLYDLFRISEDLGVSIEEVRKLFEQKCQAKGIKPEIFQQRFEDRVDRYRERWATEMREHVSDPPPFDDVVRKVSRHLRAAGLISR